jgi:hypothetical protein
LSLSIWPNPRQRRQQFSSLGIDRIFRQELDAVDILLLQVYDSILGDCSCCVSWSFCYFDLKKKKEKSWSGWVGNEFQWEGNELPSENFFCTRFITSIQSPTQKKREERVILFFFFFRVVEV